MSNTFYFAFPDGVLHYDCARCTALCCRGYGIAAHDRELVQLLTRAPELASWATSRNRSIVHFQNPIGSCYFLDGRDRCGIEQELGRAHKPSLCKAFPFNRIVALGNVRVVSPHLLCPVQLELPATRERAGDHARLAEELANDGWLDQDFAQLTLPDGQDAESFLVEEQRFREQCARALASSDAAAGWEQSLELGDVAALMDWDVSREPSFDAWYYALAPSWSIELSQQPERVRRRALILARAHMRHAFSLQGARSTLQIYHSFWNANAALYELLAQFDRPMRQGCLIDTGDAASLLAAAVIDRSAQRGASVLEALREGCLELRAIDRQTLLNALALMVRKRAQRRAAGADLPTGNA
jgi:Fe-S-cluster containining protein